MSLLKYEFVCTETECNEQFFIINDKESHQTPLYCPFCATILDDEIVEDDNEE